jgi:energy-converting hydrogenase Eha subunit A
VESLLVNTEIVAVTLLTFVLALVIEPLMVMAVLGLASKAAQRRPLRPAPEPRVAELRLLAAGAKTSARD